MKLWGRLDWDDVRCACIAHDWYTCGTNDEYRKLADAVTAHYDVNLADSETAWCALSMFANDIKRHSDTGYEVEGIAQALLAEVTFYFKEED